MSKTIYLDGTETLIYTRSLIENNYRPNSMVSLDEMEVVECIRTACLYPGQFCCINFNTPKDPYKREALARKFLAALDLREHHCYELRVHPDRMSLMIRTYRRNDRLQYHYPIKAEIPWLKSIP